MAVNFPEVNDTLLPSFIKIGVDGSEKKMFNYSLWDWRRGFGNKIEVYWNGCYRKRHVEWD